MDVHSHRDPDDIDYSSAIGTETTADDFFSPIAAPSISDGAAIFLGKVPAAAGAENGSSQPVPFRTSWQREANRDIRNHLLRPRLSWCRRPPGDTRELTGGLSGGSGVNKAIEAQFALPHQVKYLRALDICECCRGIRDSGTPDSASSELLWPVCHCGHPSAVTGISEEIESLYR